MNVSKILFFAYKRDRRMYVVIIEKIDISDSL